MQATTDNRRPSPIRVLVWCAWGCVAYAYLGWKAIAPEQVTWFAVSSVFALALGCLLSVVFLAVAARTKVAVLNGIYALVANGALLAALTYAMP